jgi:hypothetical protein
MANVMPEEAFHHDFSKKAKIPEIANTTAITITFILESAKAHNGL